MRKSDKTIVAEVTTDDGRKGRTVFPPAKAYEEGIKKGEDKYVVYPKRPEISSGGAPKSYTLTFVENGGSSVASMVIEKGADIDLSPYSSRRIGFTFAGWCSDLALSKPITSIVMDDHKTVYARWTPGQVEAPEPELEPVPEEEKVAGFDDVKKSDWFAPAVEYTTSNKLMTGMSSTLFAPHVPLTRAMNTQVVHNTEGNPAATAPSTFTDVHVSMWYAAAIAWGEENKIVWGYGDGTFGPDHRITREQLAAILYRYAQFKGVDVSASSPLTAFTDGDTASAYAIPALQWAVGAGLMQGKGDGVLDPRGIATRAEIAQFYMIYHRDILQ